MSSSDISNKNDKAAGGALILIDVGHASTEQGENRGEGTRADLLQGLHIMQFTRVPDVTGQSQTFSNRLQLSKL